MQVLAERDTRWADDALCVTFGCPDAWFPDPPAHDREDIRRYREEVSEAQKVCALCPVRQECLKDALGRGEEHGIWGGVNMYRPERTKEEAA